MKFTRLRIPDVILIDPAVLPDARGFFFETYREDAFAKNGIKEKFVQDNHSRSQAGVLRGLHYQKEPAAQAKLVRVIRGKVFDVALDIRKDSKTFGQHVSFILSEENRAMVYVPRGFAHGFCVLEGPAEFLYKVSNLYAPQEEAGILWKDPALGIAWPKLDQPTLLSEKDQKYPTFEEVFGKGSLKKSG